MSKVLTGKVISIKMANSAVVEVTRFVPHKLYKKLLKRSKNFKVDTTGVELTISQTVKIVETKPLSRDKHFKVFVETTKEKKKPSVAKAMDDKEAKA